MNHNQEKINQLIDKLESLMAKQERFASQIRELSQELFRLKEMLAAEGNDLVLESNSAQSSEHLVEDIAQVSTHADLTEIKTTRIDANETSVRSEKQSAKSNLERYIGESIVSKVGILITIVGVAIATRYAIENRFLSPTIRIVIGYLFGAGLLGVALNLKKKYENYSAVLLSGSMAIMYFITFVAYNFFNIFPQSITFILMLIFTAFTVMAALRFKQQVIAHIGSVGAYAIPLLLSDGSGRIEVMFAYMTIINIGILAISVSKYWKSVYLSSFGVTWLAFIAWMLFRYKVSEHFGMAFGFLVTFFVIFHLTFLLFKILRKDRFNITDIILLLSNSFVFYFLGYAMLSEKYDAGYHLGLFTIGNALVHSLVGILLSWQKSTDKNLLYLVLGLVMVFVTIAIPVQLNGNWVTLLWAGEAAILFWIGRTKGEGFYEKLAFPVILLAFLSLAHDWIDAYYVLNPQVIGTWIVPIVNGTFLTSIITISLFAFINVIDSKVKRSVPLYESKSFGNLVRFTLPAILVTTLFLAFVLEISTYWSQLFADSSITLPADSNGFEELVMNADIPRFKLMWLISYSLLFFAGLSLFAAYKIKRLAIHQLILVLNAIVLAAFLTAGLYTLSELRASYLNQSLADYYAIGKMNIAVRYTTLALVAAFLFSNYRMVLRNGLNYKHFVALELVMHTSILWIASSELISWMDLAHSTQSDKLGLTILWGVYALILVMLGLWRKRKYLRIGALVLFAITLVKLFLYDIAHLDTISKTIVLLSLGLLMLVVSFLYNKYKHLVGD